MPSRKRWLSFFFLATLSHALCGGVSAPGLKDYERLYRLDVVFVDTGIATAHSGLLQAPANTFITGAHGEMIAHSFEDQLEKIGGEPARGVEAVWRPAGDTEGQVKSHFDSFIPALNWAISIHPLVLNLSMSQKSMPAHEQEIYQRACQLDIVVVAAAGNRGFRPDGATEYPAALDLPCVVAVGTLDNGFPRNSSSRGRAWLEKVDGDAAGTSFSCARMSAIAVRYRQLHPRATAAEVKRYLETKYALPPR